MLRKQNDKLGKSKLKTHSVLGKIALPIAIVASVMLLAGTLYAIQVNKQRSIEKQQSSELQAKKEQTAQETAQKAKELDEKKVKDCYNIELDERKLYDNVVGSGWNGKYCVIRYSTHDYDGVDCNKFENLSTERLNCELKFTTKDFYL